MSPSEDQGPHENKLRLYSKREQLWFYRYHKRNIWLKPIATMNYTSNSRIALCGGWISTQTSLEYVHVNDKNQITELLILICFMLWTSRVHYLFCHSLTVGYDIIVTTLYSENPFKYKNKWTTSLKTWKSNATIVLGKFYILFQAKFKKKKEKKE